MGDLNDWIKAVKEAWQAFRDETALSETTLAQTSLVSACALAGDDVPQRRFAVQAILEWMLLQLEKTGKKIDRQQAEILRIRYIEGLTVREVQTILGKQQAAIGENALPVPKNIIQEKEDIKLIPKSTIQARQRAAFKKTGNILVQEMTIQQGVAWYRQRSIQRRIESTSHDERRLLQFLAVFNHVVPREVTMRADDNINSQLHILRLQQANLLLQSSEGIALHSEVRTNVINLTPLPTIFRHHATAARFYEQKNQFSFAIYHWQQSGEQETAAHLLLTHEAILGTQVVQERLEHFSQEKGTQKVIKRDTWAKLQLLRGHIIEQSQNNCQQLDEAIKVYTSALGADDVLIQAKAFYRLARAHQRKGKELEAALNYYISAIQLLETTKLSKIKQLLAKIYISRAWIYIDQLPNTQLAQQDLKSAEKYLDFASTNEQLPIVSDWHNARGKLFQRQQQWANAQNEQHNAWTKAYRSGDVTRTIKTGYNLACTYLRMEQLDEAYSRLLDSQSLAQNVGNKRMVALCNKSLGSYYVLQEQYTDSIPYYEAAYEHFVHSGNSFWLASTCHNLAQVLTIVGELEKASKYLEQGIDLVEKETELAAAFEKLQKRYLELSNKLTTRQRNILHHTRIYNHINKRTCQDLLGISARQATRELSILVKLGLLRSVGRGPATYYVF